MEEGETIELYELSFSDLKLLSSSSPREQERLELLRRDVMEALGPTGPGLLCITGVAGASALRRKLLPLARKLALLGHDQRKRVLKEHNLGSDVPLKNPDRSVSSFAMQLKYAQSFESINSNHRHDVNGCSNSGQDNLDVNRMTDFEEDEFKNLGSIFRELGFCMMELGLSIARICDMEIGGQELELGLVESCAAKGRLIHYHSTMDNLILRETGRRKKSVKRTSSNKGQKLSVIQQTPLKDNLDVSKKDVGHGIHFNLWQQWHYDYGIFTVLTDPMFLSSSMVLDHPFSVSSVQECASPNGSSYLQIYHPSMNKVLVVKTPPESFIIQVGESADVLSKGKLRSTLHCVSKPLKVENVSRETFVVFLQPAWSKTFSISDYMIDNSKLASGYSEVSNLDNLSSEQEQNELARQIQKIVPSLSSRLKDGMTFAEFSRETTKQYYGGNGLQSNR